MKTTSWIHDELLRTARRFATEAGTTLRAPIEEGRRSALARGNEPPPVASFPLRVFGSASGACTVAPYDLVGLQAAMLDGDRAAGGAASRPASTTIAIDANVVRTRKSVVARRRAGTSPGNY